MEGTKLTGLWKNTSKAGKDYLSGRLGAGKLLVIQNEFKKKDSDPDYIAWLAPHKRNGDSPNEKPESQEDIGF